MKTFLRRFYDFKKLILILVIFTTVFFALPNYSSGFLETTILDPVIQFNQSGTPYIVIGGTPSGDYNDLNVSGEGLTYNISEAGNGGNNITIFYDSFSDWGTASNCQGATASGWSQCIVVGTISVWEANNSAVPSMINTSDSKTFEGNDVDSGDLGSVVKCIDASSFSYLYLKFALGHSGLDSPNEWINVTANKTGQATWTNIRGVGNSAPSPLTYYEHNMTDFISTYTCFNITMKGGGAGTNNDRGFADDFYIFGTQSLYRVEIWHNSSQIADGNMYNVNATINFTINVSDTYSLQIYDFANSQWVSNGCDSDNVLANTPTQWWCNMTTNPMNYNSSDRRVRIRINSTPVNDASLLQEDYVQYYVGYQAAYLEVSLINPDPSQPLNIGQNQTFDVNATVVCRRGPCGNVYGTVRYNLSSSIPNTAVNITTGDKPFFIQESPANAMKSCGVMYLGDSCQLNWTINATANINTDWKIGVLFNSSYPEIQWNNTNNVTVSIFACSVDIDAKWSSTNFGSLAPSTLPYEAPGNANKDYNISVKPGSCMLDLYINGTDLINTTYNSRIKVGNVTWSNTTNTYSSSYNLSSSATIIKLGVSENTNVTTYYWLNVPPVYAGRYNGNISFYGVKNGQSPP